MEELNRLLWQTKLAAWLHDPAEKSLILMRTPDGHEAGTVARLRELCFGSEKLADDLDRICRLADHWAAAADRPQWPRPKEERHLGDNISFWDGLNAVLVHPLGGDQYDLEDLYIDKAGRIEAACEHHFEELLASLRPPAEVAAESVAHVLRTAFLRLWRLGADNAPHGLSNLGHLWRLLPADSRVPDHSIWEHLSLASAFAGAVSGDVDGNPALLLVSLGPVQGFIEQSRSVSDLWAGSHLLSMMSWQAMKVVAERFGPDSVIFPSLWGVPLVDVWLEREMGVTLPDNLDWKQSTSDANPLFSPCLPNRFVAVVPAAAAEKLAQEVCAKVRTWVKDQAIAAATTVLGEAQALDSKDVVGRQVDRQLAGFPDVYWASVPFGRLIEWDDKGQLSSVDQLRHTLSAFCGGVGEPGFFSHPLWALLGPRVGAGDRELRFAASGADAPLVYTANAGAVYPALSDLLERAHAAAKAARAFDQVREEGYRCDVCGEWEWLRAARDADAHTKPRGRRSTTLWQALADQHKGWVRRGEHLCARCTLKRLWPDVFVDWVRHNVESLEKDGISRYVVSTHTMALAPDLAQLPPTKGDGESDQAFQRRMATYQELSSTLREQVPGGVPLPRKLVRELERKSPDHVVAFARKLPLLLDALREKEESKAREDASVSSGQLARVRRQLQTLFGHEPEAYYGLILMDGDGMGKWMAGDAEVTLRQRDTWHPSLLDRLEKRFQHVSDFDALLEAPRAASPSHHAAVSTALNGFSLHVARWVVEELFYGRLIYSGGDDVLAMVAVDDLLPCMLTLRCAYSGILPAGEREAIWELYRDVKERLTAIDRGYVRLGGARDRLLRMMGGRATASAGAVVAHHTAPLQAVLRRLRQAEKAAKSYGRNAFSIALMKRAGGETTYTASWGFGGIPEPRKTANDERIPEPRDVPYDPQQWRTTTSGLRTPMGVLFELRDTLAAKDVSRRAAYHTLSWLGDIPSAPGEQLSEADLSEMLSKSIAYQLGRQGVKPAKAESLASAMVKVAIRQCRPNAIGGKWAPVTDHLKHMITVAEFLAREGRTGPGRALATDEPANQGGGA